MIVFFLIEYIYYFIIDIKESQLVKTTLECILHVNKVSYLLKLS